MPGTTGLHRQGAFHYKNAAQGGGLCYHARGDGYRHLGAGDAGNRSAARQGVYPLLRQPPGGNRLHLAARRPTHRVQEQVRGSGRGAQLDRNCCRQARRPGNPHGQEGPHPHQGPQAAGGQLPQGRAGSALGGHPDVRRCALSRRGAPGGGCWQHEQLHGCHDQFGQKAVLLWMGGLHLLQGWGGRDRRHDPHAPPIRP